MSYAWSTYLAKPSVPSCFHANHNLRESDLLPHYKDLSPKSYSEASCLWKRYTALEELADSNNPLWLLVTNIFV
jgi:hypothetical protein